MAEWSAREEWLRKQSCCNSEPACKTCPLIPANSRKSLAQLTREALLGGEPGPGDE